MAIEQGGAVLATIDAIMPNVDGDKLKELRDARFLSHRELAKIAGVSPTTVLTLEAGKTEAQRRTVRKLAEALEVDPRELLEDV